MPISSPTRSEPVSNWEHKELYELVKDSIYTTPNYFDTDTFIEGISATDIFTLNSALGATIESQVVQTLNRMRPIWDPDEKYLEYSFVRQAQTFPDVLLRKKTDSSSTPIMGIELKGWYLLAKEGEPSFRYKVTPDACARQDLIVIVPWALDNVISGSPSVFTPYVESAKYAAEFRNYWWQEVRDTSLDTTIHPPDGVSPYPNKSDQITDRPEQDSGGNFGRYARTGLMDDYIDSAKREQLCGISADHWLRFFSLFKDQSSYDSVSEEINGLSQYVETYETEEENEKAQALRSVIQGLKDLIE